MKRDSGFSLIEVLVAMLILSVGAASVLSLFAAAASTHRRAIDRTRAALVAERVLGEVRALYEPGALPEEISEAVGKKLPATIDGYRWDLVVLRPAGSGWNESEIFARVTVRWPESGDDRAEPFSTIILPFHRPRAD